MIEELEKRYPPEGSKRMDKRLLDAKEIDTVWRQLSMKPLSNAMFRFAAEIAMAQLAKLEPDQKQEGKDEHQKDEHQKDT